MKLSLYTPNRSAAGRRCRPWPTVRRPAGHCSASGYIEEMLYLVGPVEHHTYSLCTMPTSLFLVRLSARS